tara:strand:- start:4713 stop:5066 length:354 start_codon:yes stop_codon:yes gene_type:complete
MTDLVCCLSTGKGTWVEVARLINNHKWDNVYLITNDFGKEKFSSEKEVKFILVDVNKGMESMKKTIISELKNKVKGDVAINFISGSGKEHMALLSGMMELGSGMRFVVPVDSEIKEL